jgi:aminopeptidase N
LRKGINNDRPIIGTYNVNNEGSRDMYGKGANMLHTLRQVIEDDEKWRQILRGLNKTFYHQTVTTKQIENYLSDQSSIDLTEFFNQYLRDTRIPTLEYSIHEKKLKYRWANIVEKFDMPIQVTINNEEQWLYPNANWQTKKLASKASTLIVNPNFFIKTNKL